MPDLSILIPSRNEMFLARTIENILENIEGDTEIIVLLDGQWADPGIRDHPRVKLIYYPVSIGQRAGTNQAAKMARGKYVMKVDAHCAFDKGFDIKMMKEMHDDWTMVPLMKNLHAFDWVCPNGHRRYQGPSGPCKECGLETQRDVVWIAKRSPKSVSYCFDSTPHFQYFGEYAKRPEGQGEITETMSLQGSCFMLTKEKYFELDICDEAFGSWGSQGIEVACKIWLSGGRVMVNKKTWYAHMFRTQGGDFGFPYPIKGSAQKYAQKYARDLFFNNKWEKQIHPLSWLVEKFWPVKGWTEEDLANLKKAGTNFGGKEAREAEEKKKMGKGKTEEAAIGVDSKRVNVQKQTDPRTRETTTTPTTDTTLNATAYAIETPDGSKLDVGISAGAQEDTPTPTPVHIVANPLKPQVYDTDRTSPTGATINKRSPRTIVTRSLNQVIPKRTQDGLTKGIVYYTDNQLKVKIAHAVQKQLRKISKERGIPIVCSSLKRMTNFGSLNIQFPTLSKGYLTMFRQILAAIENSTTDIIYFCEHDILYSDSHFDFTPTRKDIFYYNQNFWKLRVEDGHAVHYDTNQLNGMCCLRELAVEEYRKRVAIVEKDGYRRNMGFEPGTHEKLWEAYKSTVPIIDIRHSNNLTKNRWNQEEFRNKNSCQGWIETDNEIPGWGSTKELIKRLN